MTRLVRTTMAMRVLSVLEEAKRRRPRGVCAAELARLADVSEGTTRKYLTQWKRDGVVEREGGAAFGPRGRIVSAYRLRQGATR